MATKGLKPRRAKSWRHPNDVHEWRRQVISADGPRSPTTRHVLLTLSLHMNKQGASCFPSYQTLARETGLCLRAVKKHMDLAHRERWFSRTANMGYASGWKRYEYEATIPEFCDEKDESCVDPRDTKSVVVHRVPDIGASHSEVGARRAQ